MSDVLIRQGSCPTEAQRSSTMYPLYITLRVVFPAIPYSRRCRWLGGFQTCNLFFLFFFFLFSFFFPQPRTCRRMASARIPPLLEPYLRLPPEAALVVLTSVLGCSANWLVLRWAYGLLSGRQQSGRQQKGQAADDGEGDGDRKSVV